MAASQTIRTLKLSLLADVTNFSKGLDNATSGFDRFSTNISRASTRFALPVLGALGAIGSAAVNAASDFAETSTAVEQVFGPESAAALQEFARNASRTLGQSRQQALNASQTFGIFGRAAGLTDSELVDFTTTLVTLAGDLASFQNTTPEQAINALGAALRGESEPIRNYGVLLDAATIQQRALADGLIETERDALSPAQRTLAIYSELLSQTALQQGNFVDTADGFANTQRTFASDMENFKLEIGEALLPILQDLLPELRGMINTITETDPETIVAVAQAVGALAAGIVSLNLAMKGFLAVKAAWSAIAYIAALAGGATLAAAGTAAAAVVGISYAAQRSIDSRNIVEESQRNPFPLSGGAFGESGRGGGFTPGRPGSIGGYRPLVTVNVSGFVGNEVQLGREIQRALDRAARTGQPVRILGGGG
jgi:hypothetical protein